MPVINDCGVRQCPGHRLDIHRCAAHHCSASDCPGHSSTSHSCPSVNRCDAVERCPGHSSPSHRCAVHHCSSGSCPGHSSTTHSCPNPTPGAAQRAEEDRPPAARDEPSGGGGGGGRTSASSSGGHAPGSGGDGCPAACAGPHQFTLTIDGPETFCSAAQTAMTAKVEPPLEGTFTWSTPDEGVQITPFGEGSPEMMFGITMPAPEFEVTDEQVIVRRAGSIRIAVEFTHGDEPPVRLEREFPYHDITITLEAFAPTAGCSARAKAEITRTGLQINKQQSPPLFRTFARFRAEAPGCSANGGCVSMFEVGYTQVLLNGRDGQTSLRQREWAYDVQRGDRVGTAKRTYHQPNRAMRDSCTSGSTCPAPWYWLIARGGEQVQPRNLDVNAPVTVVLHDSPGRFDPTPIKLEHPPRDVHLAYRGFHDPDSRNPARRGHPPDGPISLKRVQWSDHFVARLVLRYVDYGTQTSVVKVLRCIRWGFTLDVAVEKRDGSYRIASGGEVDLTVETSRNDRWPTPELDMDPNDRRTFEDVPNKTWSLVTSFEPADLLD